jgi:hypothetical protein
VEEDGGDFLCRNLVGAATDSFTEHFHIVTAKANTQFYFMGKDDFLTASADKGDTFAAESGECTQQ